jgi:hypothetical protein
MSRVRVEGMRTGLRDSALEREVVRQGGEEGTPDAKAEFG